MATTGGTTAALSMKLIIDRKTQHVLLAEASKEVVDFLFSLLALPVATAVKLLGKDAMVGCVANLYASVDKLDPTYVLAGASKDSLLCPAVLSPPANASRSVLGLPVPDPLSELTLYRCTGTGYPNCRTYITDTKNSACPTCGYALATEAKNVPPSGSGQASVAAKGFVHGVVTYTVADNLTVMPMSANSAIAMLNFPVMELFDLQEKTVQLGCNECLAILKASLQSKTVLTDVFLPSNGNKKAAAPGGRA